MRNRLLVCSPLLLSVWIFAQADHQLKKISLEEVLSVGAIDDDLIYQWAGVTTDEEGNIYLTDLKDYALKKFDRSGRLLKKAGKKGPGPGELDSPVLIEYSAGKLYVSEIYRAGIQVFDKELNFLWTIPLSFPTSNLLAVSSDELAISEMRPSSQGRQNEFFISLIDPQGHVKKRIPYVKNDEIFLLQTMHFCFDQNRDIVLVYLFKDRIEKIDQTGRQIFMTSVLGIKKPKTRKSPLGELPEEVVYKAVDIDQEGNIFVLGGHLSKNRSRDIYVLSPDGEYLCTFTLPEPSHTIHIDKENFLYSRAQEGVTLKKYSMKYDLE